MRGTIDSGDNVRVERNRSRSTDHSPTPQKPRNHSASSKSSLKAEPKYTAANGDVRQ